MAKLGRRATFEERLGVCRQIEAGQPSEQVAARSGFGRSTVFGWWQAYRRAGTGALHTRHTPGPRARLDQAQLARLRSLIVEDLETGSHDGPILHTRKGVGALIAATFGTRLSPVSVGRTLERAGIPLVSPLTRFQEAEAAGDWPGGTQTALQATPTAYYVWIEPLPPLPPDNPHRPDHEKPGLLLSAIGAGREVHFRAVLGCCGTDAFIHLCQTLPERAHRPALVVAEASTATCSGKVARYFADAGKQLSLLLLPARSDATAPDEDAFEDVMVGGLQCDGGSPSLVAFNDGREMDPADLELALRSASRRM